MIKIDKTVGVSGARTGGERGSWGLPVNRQRLRESLVVCELAEALLTRVWDRISDSHGQLARAEPWLASGQGLLHGAKPLLSAAVPPPQGCG
jgi:hypothetical protein